MDPVVHLDPTLCRQCGGLCCQGHPGVWSDPERFATLFFAGRAFRREELEARLEGLQLELRDYSGVAVPAPKSTDSGCIFLQPGGCRLDPAVRPCQCLGLEPDLDTLMTGELHCRMPSHLGYDRVRSNWQNYWQKQKTYLR
ncbi:hypothetical protein EDC39_10150 [Geothermobacter ehrlichii]|uniref:Uncharacterized protein n=1 Tax=Geothermobacter ehrlichii TaxID=213224 RepID=A0A5D3WM22_9BACT|nr:hypothetical protein [Geothermobacter ehrlichii]TYO99890.1 hypothetical protein EDC39_10150 [Geothermobacter ehrlichii]